MQKCKDKIIQKARKNNISINEATFSTSQESTYSVEEAKQLLGNMQFSDSESGSDLLDRYIQEVTIDEINLANIILYKVKVNNLEVESLYDTGTSISVMSKHFFDRLQNKPKLIRCNRSISGAGGETLIPVGKCFIQLQIGKRTFQDRVIIIENLICNYILGQGLHRNHRLGTGYSITGRHYININGEMIAQSILQGTTNLILKTKGKVALPPMSVSVVEIKTPIAPAKSNNLYELTFDTFQLPKGVIPLDVLHRMAHKTPKILNIPIMNTNNTTCSLTKICQ